MKRSKCGARGPWKAVPGEGPGTPFPGTPGNGPGKSGSARPSLSTLTYSVAKISAAEQAWLR